MAADAATGAETERATDGWDRSGRPPTDHPVVLFDGVCTLCHSLVQFVIERDDAGRFRFASLQSPAGQALLEHFDIPTDDYDTFVLVDGEEYHTRSTAALNVLGHLGLPWSLLSSLLVVPGPLRDLGYDLVADSRYRVFGRRGRCMRPTADQRDRFLDGGLGPTE